MIKGNTFHQIGITLCILLWIFHLVHSKWHVSNVKITKKNYKVFYWRSKQYWRNKEQRWVFSFLSPYTHKKAEWPQKKKTLGQKDLERDCCWTFSLAFFLLIWPWRECFYEFRMRTKTSSKTVSRWRWLNPTTTTVLHTYMLRNMMRCFGWFLTGNLLIVRGCEQGHHMQKLCCLA